MPPLNGKEQKAVLDRLNEKFSLTRNPRREMPPVAELEDQLKCEKREKLHWMSLAAKAMKALEFYEKRNAP